MRKSLRYILVVLATMQISNCKDVKTGQSCNLDITYPESQYKYPKSPIADDTALIYAGFKDSLSRRDSFFQAFYGYHFLKSFEEDNLSVAPTGNTILRISFDPSFAHPFVLKMTCNEIVLKTSDSGYVIPPENLSMFTEKEKTHYLFLLKHFPLTDDNLSSRKKGYIDSMVKVAPELQSPAYYRYLKEKALQLESSPLKFTVYSKTITKEQFSNYIQRLNKANFWSLPYRMEYDPAPTDGDGYFVELHTPELYRMVISSNCPDISKELTQICQEIIDEIAPKSRKLILCH